MSFKISTYGESTAIQESPVASTEIAPTITEEITTPIVEPTVTEVTPTEDIVSAPEVITPQAEEPIVEENTANFSIPEYAADGKPIEPTAAPTPTQTDWRDAIKNIDPKEILKALNVNDFAIELNEHLSKGGDASKYLEAKAIDYNKVSDIDLARSDFNKKHESLSQEDRDYLFNKKFVANEFDDEDVQRDKRIELQILASEVRQKKIAEQQQYEIPASAATSNEVDPAQQLLIQQQREADEKAFYENEATQNLIKSKRVAINLGGDKPFYFNIDKPEQFVKAMRSQEQWQRLVSVNPGEPDKTKLIADPSKIQRMYLAGLNPNYEKDIYNAGVSAGEKKVIDEKQNAVRPITKPNIPKKETLGEAFKTRAKVSTYGSN